MAKRRAQDDPGPGGGNPKASKAGKADDTGGDHPSVRLDKWLCAARFFKTRALSGEAISGGHVHVNGTRSKPSRPLFVGDKLDITRKEFAWSVAVTGLGEKRGSADRARELYEETPQSIARRGEIAAQKRAMAIPQQTSGGGRPSKHDRRLLEKALRKRLL